MSTPIKYNSFILPSTTQRQPGDFVLRRMIDKSDVYEEVILRPVNGANFTFDADGIPTASYNVQAVSPLTGATVAMANNAVDSTLNITPAGTIAALTVTLPSDATSRIGQVERISTSQTITTLTISGASTIRGNVTTLSANGFVAFQKIAANTWARIA